ncbi:RsmB/NOP family class I SAM-dependent RNA methyltransferase [Nocardioides terrisoli]|uniref:RsmB/NOP family class I SAM-dependent RNA methyltransferase n=1 Tax=Nocardioides terrisoli TaxID=3388267 RepID=UPI00287B79AD|nr:RsmB/NOP family class I SAM-dependent RNA methyltransferase [Nocardioides marmorisolisilvae]
MAVDPARRLSFDVLRAVDGSDAYANLELARLIRERRLDGRDAAFATELTSGTLRMRGAYDAVIDALVTRPLDPPVRDALRLGCHQLLSMRVPAHAAVATTVSLVRTAIGHRPSGLVNAVLRRVGARTLPEWMDHLDATPAVRASHPQWVVDLLAEALGDDPTALLEADNDAPRVTLVARPGLATVEELGGRALPVSPYAVELESGDPSAIPAVREGRAGVQDAGSQLVALALAAAPVEGRDRLWLDLCAGPGGKAALLGALAAGRGATLIANERQPHRAVLVASGARALPPGALKVVAGDGTAPAWRPGTFDRVLVDAPCTGLGALRRRPEARWRRRPEDLDALVPLQNALLHAALDSVRPGGVVGYATCSPVPAETAEVVRAVLAVRDDVRLLEAPPLVGWVEAASSRTLPGAVQLWPHLHGTDAMFLSLLRRAG